MNNQEKKSKKKEPERGVLRKRLEELNEEASAMGYPGLLYPQKQREKKPLSEIQKEATGDIKKVGILEAIKKAVDEIFGAGLIDWKKIEKADKKESDKLKKKK